MMQSLNTADVDFETYIGSLCEGSTIKGMMFIDLIESAPASQHHALLRLNIARWRYLRFADYPQHEYLRLMAATAKLLYPQLPDGEAARRLARHHFARMANFLTHKALVRAFIGGPERLLPLGARFARYFAHPTFIECVRVDRRVWRYELRSMPGAVEPLWLGAAEGMLNHYGLDAAVTLHRWALGNFDLLIVLQ